MLRFGLRDVLFAVSVFCVLLGVAVLHGQFATVLLFVALPLAITTTLLTSKGIRLNPLVAFAVTVFVSGIGTLLVHHCLGGTIRQQPGRLSGAVAIACVLWFYTTHIVNRLNCKSHCVRDLPPNV